MTIVYQNARLRAFLLVAFITIIGALIRLPGLLHDGLFRDEALVYVDITAPSVSAFFERVAHMEWHPPLYFILAFLWTKIAGFNELAFKLLPYLFSVATIPLVYRLGKTVASAGVGLGAAALIAISPAAVERASVYLYPVSGFFCILLACLVADYRRKPMNAARWIALAAATALAIYTHYIGLVCAVALAGWNALLPQTVKHKAILTSAILAGFCSFLLWLPVFSAQRAVGLPIFGPLSALAKLYLGFNVLWASIPLSYPPLRLAFFVLLCASAYLALRSRRRLDALALGGIFILAIALMDVESFPYVRYIIPLYGLFCVFMAASFAAAFEEIGTGEAGRRWPAAAAAAFFVIATTTNAAAIVERSALPRSGIKTFLAERAPSCDTLYLIAPYYLATTFAFYSKGSCARYLGFVRLQHPEIYLFGDEVRAWNDPDALTRTLRALDSDANRYARLDLIVDKHVRDEGRIRFGRTWDLVRAVKSRYRLASESTYPGQNETVLVLEFDLHGARPR